MNWIRPVKRLAIYLRDGLACVYCGATIEDGARLTLDVTISGIGFYRFELHSKKAQLWTRRHVALEPWQMTGHTFVLDDTRMAQDIADAMAEAGLTVR